MSKARGSDDDSENEFGRPSPLSQTQRFTKSGTVGTKDFKTTSPKPRHNEVSSLKLNLDRVNDNEDDSLNDSDEDTNTKTGRSTSSVTTSQLTPKPKDRSFMKKDAERPAVKPRLSIDDDLHSPFGQATMKPSPRYQPLSLKEEEERNQSFMHGFSNEKKRQSPEMFATDYKSDSRRPSGRLQKGHEHKERSGSDDDSLSNRQTKPKDFTKAHHSPTDSDKSPSRKHSHKSNEESDQSDREHDHSNKQSKRTDFTKQRQSNHDLRPTSPKATDSHAVHHQPSSSRPRSASKEEPESARRSSHREDQDTVIPPVEDDNPRSRPTSAKSNTTRQRTQFAIDNVTSANNPPALDPLTSNNESLAATLQSAASAPPPLPRPSATLPPRHTQKPHRTTTDEPRSTNKKKPYRVPSRYQEIASRTDTGRTPLSQQDLTRSVERALKKAIKSQTLPRPQSARVMNQSLNASTGDRQRRRSSSGYEHVPPRVNTNLSVNVDDLDTSQMRAESSQSIKDSVYLEWLKTKQDQKKIEKEELKRWQEEKTKRVDRAHLERKIQQDAQNLQQWREKKEKEIKEQKQEELRIAREKKEEKKQAEQQRKKDAKLGFDNWAAKKSEKSQEQIEEEEKKKAEIERRQEEKQARVLESEKAYQKWTGKKTTQIKTNEEAKKTIRDDQLKKIRAKEETDFVSAQEAYEKWLKEKDKSEEQQRRNSLSRKPQPQVPFLPGGAQKNTGKVRHAVW